MAYTALEKMRKINKERFGENLGPFQPKLKGRSGAGTDLGSATLRFLHEACEGLRFSTQKEAEEAASGRFLGTGTAPGQIPYNMQMDLDRLCLERELERFTLSGTAEDAYTVYYCFMEMFLGRYGKSKKMVELLSEFESNASSLLMKHRDHYSHSVYVFALGLAVYESNANFRKAFQSFYGFSAAADDLPAQQAAACSFLEFWGLTSLFHDIGYPFELPFEQVLSYFEVDGVGRGKDALYIAYRNIRTVTAFSRGEKAHFSELFGKPVDNVNALLAAAICMRLGEAYGISEEGLAETLEDKPTAPDRSGYFMDHAWFSAVRLYQELAEAVGAERMDMRHLDALTAIALHNSLYKFSVAFYKDKEKRRAPLKMELHPLAYLLMLCDELQCWDRKAYGRNSRTELHPMAAEFDFSDNALKAVYYYDDEEKEKIRRFQTRYAAWEAAGEQGDPPRLKAYSDMAEKEQRFTRDIEKIVDTSGIPLTVIPKTKKADRSRKHTYLSSSNFLHLYDFAVALNGRYNYIGREDEVPPEQLEEEFGKLSLEYQLSNINQAKSFSRYLNEIGCFYTDKPVDLEMVRSFTSEELDIIAPMEHERWALEHLSMGWHPGNAYETLPLPEDSRNLTKAEEKERRTALREQFRCHKLAVEDGCTEEEIFRHYENLSPAEQKKDYEPFNSMMRLIRKYDGLRIYRLE